MKPCETLGSQGLSNIENIELLLALQKTSSNILLFIAFDPYRFFFVQGIYALCIYVYYVNVCTDIWNIKYIDEKGCMW